MLLLDKIRIAAGRAHDLLCACRHHRYIFEEKKQPKSGQQQGPAVGARLQELGPRFTLKLRSLQVRPGCRLHVPCMQASLLQTCCCFSFARCSVLQSPSVVVLA